MKLSLQRWGTKCLRNTVTIFLLIRPLIFETLSHRNYRWIPPYSYFVETWNVLHKLEWRTINKYNFVGLLLFFCLFCLIWIDKCSIVEQSYNSVPLSYIHAALAWLAALHWLKYILYWHFNSILFTISCSFCNCSIFSLKGWPGGLSFLRGDLGQTSSASTTSRYQLLLNRYWRSYQIASEMS